MIIVRIINKLLIFILLFNIFLSASDFEKLDININKNKVKDEILITYKDYFWKENKIELEAIKSLDDIDELYQKIKFDVYIDDKLVGNFYLKAIKYLQDNYLNGYSYEIKDIRDNGFMLNVNTNTSYNYKLFFLYQNKLVLKYILVSSIFQQEYKICSYSLDIDINYNLLDIDNLTKNRRLCYFDNRNINLNIDNVVQYNNIAYYLQHAKIGLIRTPMSE